MAELNVAKPPRARDGPLENHHAEKLEPLAAAICEAVRLTDVLLAIKERRHMLL
jgi:hypothetical protein